MYAIRSYYVGLIGDGEQKLCGEMIGLARLNPNQNISGNFSWSQYAPSNGTFKRVPPGNYFLNVGFNGSSGSHMVSLLGENTSMGLSPIRNNFV